MPHASITHPRRGSLEFRQAQQDGDTQSADANVISDTGSGLPPLVHVESRERERQIRGLVTGPRRAEADPDTNDWQQALANYIVQLERHVDTLQGEGYTFEDTIRGETVNAVYHAVEWTLKAGRPYEIDFDATLTIGSGVFPPEPLDVPDVTVDSSMDVAARVGGVDLPGLRQMRVRREFPTDVTPLYNKSSAEVNDVKASGSTQHQIEFEGTHTGTDSQRAAADDALEALIGDSSTTFETRFPGYSLDGAMMEYESNLESTFGTNMHQYRLRFLEAREA